jgi:hypothetical protein
VRVSPSEASLQHARDWGRVRSLVTAMLDARVSQCRAGCGLVVGKVRQVAAVARVGTEEGAHMPQPV